MNIEQLQLEQKVAEQEIIRQSLQEKNEKIKTLEQRVELLEGMLNRLSAFQGGLPQPQPLPALRNSPRRWSVR